MFNLTEIDLSILIGIGAGFFCGVLFGITDDVLELISKNRRISFINAVRKYILTGFTLGIFFGSLTFACASLEIISIQTLNRVIISSLISISLVAPIVSKVFELIFSRFFSQS
jgi:hypothetical protein